MRRLLLCLIPCALLAAAPSEAARRVGPPQRRAPAVKDDGRALSDAEKMQQLAKDNPVAFLEECLRRYQRTVKGYTLTMQKRERLGGKLHDEEIVRVAFREEPHSVLLHWQKGARLAERALYVEGENDGKMLALPAGRILRLAGVVSRDVEGDEARRSGRFTLKEFGLKNGMLRTLRSWQAARENGALHVEYLGEEKVKEAGDRTCYVLRRTRYPQPEADGVTGLTAYIDKENWLQVGTVTSGEGDQLIGAYYFRDIVLNPEFKPEQFKREALKP
jgi:hypothetical protein